ncbi:translation initiation factor [Bdellovibrio sp. HCB290]|uniref:translation initiation factor n=1 Tax=Bdellovibrio sp. HCB290 TaxID=3394356 RepID=UPI0039B5681E
MSNTRLVYSTDPKDNVVCPQCKELKSECKCRPEDDASQKFVVIFRLEKNGRGGKTVTVLDGLPRNEEFLKGFAKELKAKCGVGGSHSIGEKFGLVEIQGDKREAVKKILQAKGIPFKGM